MSGLYLGKNDSYIERVSKQGEELSLLAKGDGIEIMTQKIKSDIVFWIDPGEDSSIMEFFYIVSGTVLCKSEDTSTELNAGEYFYVQNLKKSTHFRTLSEVTMLYVASQPVFHLLSDEIEKLIEISKKAEEKDMYTHDHGLRLKDYSVRIGKKMNLSEKKLDVLYYTASFHDIGKIDVPDEILKKPGRLTTEEFVYIKKHPISGELMIKNTFLKECAEGIVQHHERLDGSGYPYGLKDKEICIEGKIIAVLDSYDAMISDRPYRKGVDPVSALEEIKSLVGKHYDKNVVKYFEEILIEDGII